tara:strand:+ start:206 stop:427 length:222 start_codon:yes stop_codon:yes gene_type:complete
MGFDNIEVTVADEKEANKLVKASKFGANAVYEQKRQEFRKAGTIQENKGLIEALSELSKTDGDTPPKKKGLFG